MGKNDFGVEDTDGNNTPSSELDIYQTIIDSSTEDEIVSGLGHGYYTKLEMWQQVKSFKKGMYADAAFARRIIDRALSETKTELGLNGWTFYDEDKDKVVQLDGWNDLGESEKEDKDRRRWVRKHSRKFWRKLPKHEQLEAIEEITGIGEGWTPPFWRMLEMRHEASRSRDARLIDNAMGARRRIEGDNSLNQQARDELKSMGGEQR